MVNVRAGSRPGIPRMPPFFQLGEAAFPGWKKRTFVTGLEGGGGGGGGGDSVLLMLVCSNVRITGECSIFDVTFYAAIWDSLEV